MRSLTIAAIGLTVDFSNHPPGIGPRSTQVLRPGRAGRWAVRLTVFRAAGSPFRRILVASLLLMAIAAPELALAQASPFMTGASALQTNARVAREYLVLLPHELDPERRIELARRFAGELSDRYGFGVDLAVHAPRPYAGSDPRNFHAHLLATTRSITNTGLGEKTEIEWHDIRRIRAGLGSSVNELLHVRRRWAEHANEALAAAGLDVRIEHRSWSRASEASQAPGGEIRQPLPEMRAKPPEALEDLRLKAALAWREMRDRGEWSKSREQTPKLGVDKDLSR